MPELYAILEMDVKNHVYVVIYTGTDLGEVKSRLAAYRADNARYERALAFTLVKLTKVDETSGDFV